MKVWYCLTFLSLLHFTGLAQWTHTHGPYGGNVYCLAAGGEYLFAGTSAGIFRTSDSVISWSAVRNGMAAARVNAMAFAGQTIFAGCYQAGVYRSSDYGSTWIQANSGLTNLNVFSLASFGSNLFAGTGNGLFLSGDNGGNWSPVTNGIPAVTVNSITGSGNGIFAGTYGNGVYRSSGNGSAWEPMNDGLTDLNILALCMDSLHLFASTETGGIFVFDLQGNAWVPGNTGLPANIHVNALSAGGSGVFAGTGGEGIYASTDEGLTWSPFTLGLYNPWVQSFLMTPDILYAGTSGGGVFLSPLGEPSWESLNNGLLNSNVTSFAASGATLFSGTYGNGIFSSSDNGTTWSPTGKEIPSPFITALEKLGSSVFAGTRGMGVFRSSQNGSTWSAANNGLENPYINALTVGHFDTNTSLYAATMNGIYFSEDSGSNWQKFTTGPSGNNILSLIVSNGKIFSGTQGSGVWFSADAGISWNPLNSGLTNLNVLSFAESGNNILAGTEEGLFIFDSATLAWNAINTPLNNHPVNSVVDIFSTPLAAGSSNGIVYYDKNGDKWISLNEGLSDTSVNRILPNAAYMYAGTAASGTWKRPLADIFVFDTDPDTLLLSQFSGQSDTLFIHGYYAWSIIGTIPDWLAAGSTTGNGDGYVVFSTLKSNLSAFRRYVTFFLYSPYLSEISFTIAQKEKSSGYDKKGEGWIQVYPVPSTGIVKIESIHPLKSIKLSNASGTILREIRKPGEESVLDLSAEGPGVYFLLLETGNESFFRKIVIL
jgi:ligand-binding sensor domain-containing protein